MWTADPKFANASTEQEEQAQAFYSRACRGGFSCIPLILAITVSHLDLEKRKMAGSNDDDQEPGFFWAWGQSSHDDTELPQFYFPDVSWLIVVVVLSIIFGVIISVVGYVGISAISYFRSDTESVPQPTLKDRIDNLSRSLSEATTIISEVEGEVNTRKNLLAQLERDRKVTEELVKLNKEQVAAVTSAIGGELNKDKRSEFWVDITQNAFFTTIGTIAGTVLGLFAPRWSRRLRRWRSAKINNPT